MSVDNTPVRLTMRTFCLTVGSMDSFATSDDMIKAPDSHPDKASFSANFGTLEVEGMEYLDIVSLVLWGMAAGEGWSKQDSFSQIEDLDEVIVDKVIVLNDGETYSGYPDKCRILVVDESFDREDESGWVKDNFHKGKLFTPDGWKTVDIPDAYLVFEDGETYGDLTGCKLVDVPVHLQMDEVDEWVKQHYEEGTPAWM